MRAAMKKHLCGRSRRGMQSIILLSAALASGFGQESPQTPSSVSWHLSDISYRTPESGSDPLLMKEKYPPNVASGNKGLVTLTLAFDVDEQGVPANLHVEKSSDPKWDAEVLAAVQEWRFNPGQVAFQTVLVPCTVVLTLGESGRATPGPLRIGRNVTPPQVIHKVPPKYPKAARKARLEGTVILFVVVDEQGNPRELRAIRPLGKGLDEAAIEAV